jgi:hypothetical protein
LPSNAIGGSECNVPRPPIEQYAGAPILGNGRFRTVRTGSRRHWLWHAAAPCGTSAARSHQLELHMPSRPAQCVAFGSCDLTCRPDQRNLVGSIRRCRSVSRVPFQSPRVVRWLGREQAIASATMRTTSRRTTSRETEVPCRWPAAARPYRLSNMRRPDGHSAACVRNVP